MSDETMSDIGSHERMRRAQLVRDSRAAATRHMPIEERDGERQQLARSWADWFHTRMSSYGHQDPVEFMPDALAELEQKIMDTVALEIADLKSRLRKAIE